MRVRGRKTMKHRPSVACTIKVSVWTDIKSSKGFRTRQNPRARCQNAPNQKEVYGKAEPRNSSALRPLESFAVASAPHCSNRLTMRGRSCAAAICSGYV